MADTNELKPCPFCGSKNVTAFARTCNKDSKYNPADRAFPIVRCRECGACSEGRDWSEPITAITKWNERATKATQPADAALADDVRELVAYIDRQFTSAVHYKIRQSEWEKVTAALRARPQAVAAFPEWISTDDLLPEHGQDVAFVIGGNSGMTGRVLGGRFNQYESFNDFSTPGNGWSASHWIPLPKAPTAIANKGK